MITNGSDRDGACGLWATALRQRVRVRPLVGYAGLTSKTLPREIGAGVSLTALGIPLNIGFAQIARLPPTAGLYALLLPAIAFALPATSRQLIAAPDAASAALVASSLGGLAVAGTAGYAAMAAAQALDLDAVPARSAMSAGSGCFAGRARRRRVGGRKGPPP